MARMDYADLETLPEDAKEYLKTRRSPGGNIFRMLAHAGSATPGHLGFGTALRKHLSIDLILYEYVIVRVANLQSAGYVIRQHEEFLRRNDISEDVILGLRTRPRPEHFTDAELAALQFTDEMVLNVRVSDETFKRARACFSPQQLMHITLTIGQYMLTCRVAETFDVDLQPHPRETAKVD